MNTSPVHSIIPPVVCRRPDLSFRRRRILQASILAVCASSGLAVRADVLDQYKFGADTQTNPVASLIPTTVDANCNASTVSSGSGLTLDPGVNPGALPASAPYLRTLTVATTSTEAAAVTNNSFFTFTLNANSGFNFDLLSLTIDGWRGGGSTGRGFALRSSVDGFTGDLLDANGTAMNSIPTVRPTATPYLFDLSGASFQDLTSITFRFYVFSPATGSSVEFDNIVLNGLSSPVIVPPPDGYLWTGTASNVWNTTDVNWTGSGNVTVPSGQYVDGADVIFDNTGTNTNPISVAAAVTPNSMLFKNSTATPYSFSGSAIHVTNGVSMTGNGSVTFNNSLTAASVTISSSSVSMAAGSSITTPSLTVNNGASINFASTATLDAATNFTVAANATLNAAAQDLAQLNGDSNGVLTLNGTALNVTGTSSYGGKITGTGSVTKNTAGTLTLGGVTSDYTGGLIVTGPGSVVLAGAKAGGALPVSVSGGATVVLGSGAAVNNSIVLDASILGSTGSPQTLGGSLTVQTDSTLTSYNAITGATPTDLAVNGLLIGSANLSILNLNGTNPELAAIRFRGPSSSYSGTITVASAGKIELQNAGVSGSPVGTATLVLPGGTIGNAANGTFSLVNLRNNSAAAGIVSDTTFGNNVQVTGFGSVFFNLLGSVAAGSQTILGDLQIGDNQTAIVGATTSAAMTLVFPTVHLTGGVATFAPKPVGNTNYLSADNLTLGTISENVPGSGFTMNGNATLTLTGVNTYTGPTTLLTGTTVLAAGSSIASSSSITVFSSATLNVNALGTFTVPAGQTLNLNGNLTALTGGVNLAGTLQGSGSLTGAITAASGAHLAPGNGPGTLFIGNLNLQSGSTLEIELSKLFPGGMPLAGADYDDLSVLDYSGGVTSTVTLGGTLSLSVGSGVELGDVYSIIVNNGSDPIVGTFAGLPNGATFSAGGQSFQISYGDDSNTVGFETSGGNDVSLLVVPEPASALLLLGGLALCTRRRRRKTRAMNGPEARGSAAGRHAFPAPPLPRRAAERREKQNAAPRVRDGVAV